MLDVEAKNVIPLRWIDTERRESLKPPPSRFHVAKVDYDVENKNRAAADDRTDDGSYQLQLTNNSNYSNSYDTRNLKSLGQYTREVLPRLDHYRNILSLHGHISRPTLDELHHGNGTVVGDPHWEKAQGGKPEKEPEEEVSTKAAVKFGWIQGVFVRCLLNIWGVMLFLRLSWIVGIAGIGFCVVIILLAAVVTVLTSLSMSAICTNGEVKGGGTYYMISRSLGPEFGGSIGLIFSCANAVAVAMYVVGFAETVTDIMFEKNATITLDKLNDMRIISCVTVVVLLGIAIIGTEWESKAQIVLLIILLAAMMNFLVGSFLPPTLEQKAQGFIGWNATLAMENFFPKFTAENGFFMLFSIFFPAATGILAGANISGDLKDPQKAIPKGTILAIIITTISYILFAVAAGSTVLRHANGLLEYANSTLIQNCSLANITACPYGLINYFQSMKLVAALDALIYAGIFAATLSSALASLVSAPKVFQALCKDNIFPYIHVFAKGYGKNNEPRRGYILTFIIALGFCAIGELNAIAPIISNFFLAAYCLINFSCFHASYSRSPGFRPSFKYYNLWLSLIGAILCLAVMFVIDWKAALITFAIVLALFIYIYYRKPDVNWGSSTQAQMYQTALTAVVKLNLVPDHVKNYRPQILILTGDPSSRPPLVDFGYMISKKLGLTICGHVVMESHSHKTRSVMTQQAYHWLQKRKIKAFYCLVAEDTFSHGVRSLIQLTGIGKLKPNVILMGYKSNWQECDPSEVVEYFNVIHDAFDMHMSLGILRVREGLDYSEYANSDELAIPLRNEKDSSLPLNLTTENSIDHNVSCSQLSQAESSRESSPPSSPTTRRSGGVSHNPLGQSPSVASSINAPHPIKEPPKVIPKEVLMSANQFQRKQKKATIDVWWLYDDGGLSMLFPYLLTTRSQWSSCKLRIFALANKKDELDREQRNMAALLSKFRIDYSDVTVIPDIVKPPQDSSKQEFNDIINKWKEKKSEKGENPGLCITESELFALKDKNNRHMRLREMLLQHSKDASLIAMTLPMPRKSTCSAPLYMAWLETLTRDMPPFLLIRGNQTSVLTFYS